MINKFLSKQTKASWQFRKKLYSKLALLLSNNVPLVESLGICFAGSNKKEKIIVSRVIERVEHGSSLAEAMSHERGFTKEELRIVETGEQTANLPQSLTILHNLLHSREQLKRKVVGALVYPSFVLVIAACVVMGIVVFILPSIVPVILSLKADIPLSTKVLLAADSFVRKYWLWLILSVLLLSLIITVLFVYPKTRKTMTLAMCRLPIIRQLYRRHMMLNIFDTASSLMASSISVEKSFEAVAGNMRFYFYSKKIDRVVEELTAGVALSFALQSAELFSEETIQLVMVGERTGSVEEIFRLCATTEKDRLDQLYKRITDLVGPVTMIFLGLFIGYIALSIITPIYTAAQHIQK